MFYPEDGSSNLIQNVST